MTTRFCHSLAWYENMLLTTEMIAVKDAAGGGELIFVFMFWYF